jgi:hypothetical protein
MREEQNLGKPTGPPVTVVSALHIAPVIIRGTARNRSRRIIIARPIQTLGQPPLWCFQPHLLLQPFQLGWVIDAFLDEFNMSLVVLGKEGPGQAAAGAGEQTEFPATGSVL